MVKSWWKLLKANKFLFLFLILFAFFLLLTRGIKLDWGEGYFFNPDENNMARGVVNMRGEDLDPEFYAYGQFPLLLSYLTNKLAGSREVMFSQAVMSLRFWSAMFSCLSVLMGYYLGKKMFSKKGAAVYAVMLIFAPGLIQAAHFGTTESIMAFSLICLTYLGFTFINNQQSLSHWILFGVVAALAFSSKVSAGFMIVPCLVFLIPFIRKKSAALKGCVAFLLVFISLSILFSPIYFLKFEEVRSTINYERGVALGSPVVFYTRQFLGSLPIVFQFTKIFPWTMGLTGFTVFILSLPFFVKHLVKKHSLKVIIPFFPGFIWFLANAFMFVKWTRFMTPLLPLLFLPVAWAINKILDKRKLLAVVLLFFSILPGILYLEIYLTNDVRIRASNWINGHFSLNSRAISEGGNVVDIPINKRSDIEIVSFDFYSIEDDIDQQEKLLNVFNDCDYVIVPSRRIFANHHEGKFPFVSSYYKKLNQKYKLLKEFKSLGPVGEFLLGSDLASEETWTVFDHPTIRIYENLDRN
jgi:4-amino-4-deoxy-L-arabinose transferase-like glycosyltransferase